MRLQVAFGALQVLTSDRLEDAAIALAGVRPAVLVEKLAFGGGAEPAQHARHVVVLHEKVQGLIVQPRVQAHACAAHHALPVSEGCGRVVGRCISNKAANYQCTKA